MKVEINNSTSVDILGEVKETKVTIDPKNLEFITHILSSNLYSKPMESFLRETISNAYDSHKEAGTEDPIIFDIGILHDQLYIRIQDFGTGIGREKFDAIYKYMGSSTKRESNEYIGSFGIGKMSALAVADSAYITDIYNGIETKYLLYKDSLTIKIDEVYCKETKERNGVEVMVYLPFTNITLINLKNSLDHLSYFDNLYISDSIPDDYARGYYTLNSECNRLKHKVEEFNNRKIKKFKNFSICSTLANKEYLQLCVGSVLYPVDTSVITLPEILFNQSFIIPIEIGSVTVTPNREQILYNDETKNVIEKAIKSVEAELNEILDNYCKGIDTIEHLKKFFNNRIYLPLCNFDDKVIQMNFLFDKVCKKTIFEVLNTKLDLTQFKWVTEAVENYTFEVKEVRTGGTRATRNLHASIYSLMSRYSNVKFKFYKNNERLQMSVRNYINSLTSRYVIADYGTTRTSIDDMRKECDNLPEALSDTVTKDVLTSLAQKFVKQFIDSHTLLDNSILTDEEKEYYKPHRNISSTKSRVMLYYDGKFAHSGNTISDLSKAKDSLYIWCTSRNELFFNYIYPFRSYIIEQFPSFTDIYFIKVKLNDVDSVKDLSNFLSVDCLYRDVSSQQWLKKIKKALALCSVKGLAGISYTNCLLVEHISSLKQKVAALREAIVLDNIYRGLEVEAKDVIKAWLTQIEDAVIETFTEEEIVLFQTVSEITTTYRNFDNYVLLLTACLLNIDVKQSGDYNRLKELSIFKYYEKHNKNLQIPISNS